jgi:hypothetical protein
MLSACETVCACKHTLLPGSRSLFLSRQEKEAKEGDRKVAALRVPEKVRSKSGSAATRLRLKHPRFFIRLAPYFFGSASSGTSLDVASLRSPPICEEGANLSGISIFKDQR